jgi:ATP-dependent Clp protease protease subunit
VQVVGIAASAASVVAMAGDDIQIGKAAIMFVHNSQWVAAGDRHVMADAADQMQVFDDIMAGLYADRSGEDDKKVHAWMDSETFFSGEQAIEAGLADDLLKSDTRRKPSAEAANASSLSPRGAARALWSSSRRAPQGDARTDRGHAGR